MRRKGKKLMLIALLSAALVATNISFVSAEETVSESSGSESSSSDSGSSSDSKPSSSDSGSSSDSKPPSSDSGSSSDSKPSSGSGSEPEEKPSSPGSDTSSENQPSDTGTDGSSEESNDKDTPDQTEDKDGAGQTEDADTDGADQTDGTDGGADGDQADGADPDAAEDGGAGEDTETGVECEDTVNPEETLPDDAAAEDTAGETEETAFTNKNGETVMPSTLVGVDYTTIAEGYDGETNVIKQYALSDTVAVNTIMESYVDENGNLVMIISQGSELLSMEPEAGDASAGGSGSAAAPSIDGSFGGWDGIPKSYEYNWDNSQNCWQWGNWVTDPVTGEQVCYKTEEGTYDSNVRHEMQLYTDGENVYLKITYATIYDSYANGNDFQFEVDGKKASYQVEWADGSQLANSSAAPGVYPVEVRHRDSSVSYGLADGAVAYYRVNENNVNNQLELKIPLAEFQRQNGDINLDNFSMIQFYTPNLMYNKISAAGSPTGSVPFAAAVFLLVPASYVWLKKKNREEEAFA